MRLRCIRVRARSANDGSGIGGWSLAGPGPACFLTEEDEDDIWYSPGTRGSRFMIIAPVQLGDSVRSGSDPPRTAAVRCGLHPIVPRSQGKQGSGPSSATDPRPQRAQYRSGAWRVCERAEHVPVRGRACLQGWSHWQHSRATRDCPQGSIRDGGTWLRRQPMTSHPSLADPDNRLPHRQPVPGNRGWMWARRRTS